MNIQEIQKFDPQNMHETYDKWPMYAKDAFKKEFSKIQFQDIDHVVLAGMGGSGAIGDIISAVLSREDIHVSVVKGYQLPNTTDENTLVVCTSVSGNTVETISILEQVKENNLKSISFSSGGEILRYLPFVYILKILLQILLIHLINMM